MIKRFEKYILIILLVLLPTQLAYHFWPSFAFVYGLRVDFLSPAVYLTDILVFLLIVLNLAFFRPYFKHLLLLTVFILINILFSVSVLETIVRWIKIVEFILFAIYISKQNILTLQNIIKTIFYSTSFFAMIGIVQFLIGHTTGLLYLLGERNFNLATPGIALISIAGKEFLRAYSTFSHPNSLSGFLGVVILLFLGKTFGDKKPLDYFCFLLITLGFILTFSLGTWVALAGILVFKNWSKLGLFLAVIISLLLPLVSAPIYLSQKINDRLALAVIAGKVITQKFFIGSGLGTFILNIPKFASGFSYSWILQPVHNIFLLAFSETGIFGLLLLVFLFFKVVRKNSYIFLFIIFTGLFDHYWLTLQQNQILLSLLIGVSFKINGKWKT